MIIPRRNIGLLLALSALSVPVASAAPVAAPTAAVQGLAGDFNEGIQLLNQGRKEEALVVFQRILASDPSNEAAYALWKDTEHDIWLDLLVEGGEFKLVANRIMDRAQVERTSQRDDEETIRGLVDTLRNADSVLDRQRAVDALSANHGEFSVPYIAPALADNQNDEWRVLAMVSLAKMGPPVVLPLLEMLESQDPFLRRNVCYTLGRLHDPRAAGPLAAQAAIDSDETVAEAARNAAAECGLENGEDGLGALLADGDAYHYRHGTVLAPYMYSSVIWSYENEKLVANPTPASIYPNELSKKAYYRGLALAPDSLACHAGVARACLDIQARVDAMAEAGQDVTALAQKSAEGSLAVALAGPDALDLALQWAVANDDATTGTLLCNALANSAKQPTAGLISALDAPDGGVRGEAAVALGRIAIQTKQAADSRVIEALGQNAGREVVRVAALIDSDAGRASQVIEALAGARRAGQPPGQRPQGFGHVAPHPQRGCGFGGRHHRRYDRRSGFDRYSKPLHHGGHPGVLPEPKPGDRLGL